MFLNDSFAHFFPSFLSLKLLNVNQLYTILQLLDALFFFFSLFSLCIIVWIIYSDLSPSSLVLLWLYPSINETAKGILHLWSLISVLICYCVFKNIYIIFSFYSFIQFSLLCGNSPSVPACMSIFPTRSFITLVTVIRKSPSNHSNICNISKSGLVDCFICSQ